MSTTDRLAEIMVEFIKNPKYRNVRTGLNSGLMAQFKEKYRIVSGHNIFNILLAVVTQPISRIQAAKIQSNNQNTNNDKERQNKQLSEKISILNKKLETLHQSDPSSDLIIIIENEIEKLNAEFNANQITDTGNNHNVQNNDISNAKQIIRIFSQITTQSDVLYDKIKTLLSNKTQSVQSIQGIQGIQDKQEQIKHDYKPYHKSDYKSDHKSDYKSDYQRIQYRDRESNHSNNQSNTEAKIAHELHQQGKFIPPHLRKYINANQSTNQRREHKSIQKPVQNPVPRSDNQYDNPYDILDDETADNTHTKQVNTNQTNEEFPAIGKQTTVSITVTKSVWGSGNKDLIKAPPTQETVQKNLQIIAESKTRVVYNESSSEEYSDDSWSDDPWDD